MTRYPCPACPGTRAAGQYLCPTCWASLPRPARRALMARGPAAHPRLRALYDQITAGVPLHRITIPTDTTGPTPMTATPAPTPPNGVHRFLVTAEPDTKTTFWALTATYANWITGRLNRHNEPDEARETWLVTVFAQDGQRFIDAASDGVTIEEIIITDDVEAYTLCAGQPGTGWADRPAPADQPDPPEQITGPYGTAGQIPPAHLTDAPATLASWIITAPGWHPAWDQYLLAVITLADTPGTPAATVYVLGATHELIVAALDPQHGPHDAATATNATLALLRPINIAEQLTATDDQARELAQLCAHAVIHGRLNPETGDAPDRIRAAWSQTIQRTLDHHTGRHQAAAPDTAPAPAAPPEQQP